MGELHHSEGRGCIGEVHSQLYQVCTTQQQLSIKPEEDALEEYWTLPLFNAI